MTDSPLSAAAEAMLRAERDEAEARVAALYALIRQLGDALVSPETP